MRAADAAGERSANALPTEVTSSADATKKAPNSPPGTTSVPISFSRLVHTCEVHSSTTPAIQPIPARNPPTNSSTIAVTA